MKKIIIVYFILVLNAYAVSEEICGDGLDNNSSGYTKGACPTGWIDSVYGSGCDLKCPSPDADNDRYTTNGTGLGYDCDDNNRLVYPGISVTCGSAGWKTCQTNGSFTACSETELDESNPGTCTGANGYYIDAVNGSDSNNGTSRATAWKNPKMFAYHYEAGTKPAGYHDPVPGDVFYFMTGNYNQSYQTSDYDNTITVRGSGMAGTANCPITIKAYPGQSPVIYNPNNETGKPIVILQTSYWNISGLGITNQASYGSTNGIGLDEATNINIFNNSIYNIRGTDDYNLSGISFTASDNINVHHNQIKDCYDLSDIDQNSTCIVAFRGANNKINDNVCYYTYDFTGDDYTPVGIKWKHGTPSASSGLNEIKNNVIYDIGSVAIASAQSNLTISGNRSFRAGYGSTYKGSFVEVSELGGVAYPQNITIEYNFAKGFHVGFGGGSWFNYISNPSNIIFRKNVLISTRTSDTSESGFINFMTYSSNTECSYVLNNSVFNSNNNCYYNSASSIKYWRFCSGSPNPDSYASDTLSGWATATGGWDNQSFYENPSLDSYHIPANNNCLLFGWRPGNTPEPLPAAFGGVSRMRGGKRW